MKLTLTFAGVVMLSEKPSPIYGKSFRRLSIEPFR